jgi:hypothetical protein
VTTVKRAPAGTTRICPHCRAVVLQSASVCPSCKKHLRFDGGAEGSVATSSFSPLRVEGSIRHPATGEGWEYAVVVTIANDRGEEVVRQLVAVGAIPPGEQRTFAFSVEVYTPEGADQERALG